MLHNLIDTPKQTDELTLNPYGQILLNRIQEADLAETTIKRIALFPSRLITFYCPEEAFISLTPFGIDPSLQPPISSIALFPIMTDQGRSWILQTQMQNETIAHTHCIQNTAITIPNGEADSNYFIRIEEDTVTILNNSTHALNFIAPISGRSRILTSPLPITESLRTREERVGYHPIEIHLNGATPFQASLPADKFHPDMKGRVLRQQARLGSGGNGTGFLVTDQSGDLKFVVKQIASKSEDLGNNIEPIIMQALMAQQVPHIPQLYDVQDIDNYRYLLESFIPGFTLATLRKKGFIFSEALVSVIALQVLYTLHAMHINQIPHGDIKPGNIILTSEGIPSIVNLASLVQYFQACRIGVFDFGSSQFGFGPIKSENPDGSPGFVPPEFLKEYNNQLRPNLCPRIDLYALINTMNYMLGSDNNQKPLALQFNGYHPVPSNLAYLKDVLEKGLGYAPYERMYPNDPFLRFEAYASANSRYQTAWEMIEAIEMVQMKMFQDILIRFLEPSSINLFTQLIDNFAKQHPNQVGFSKRILKEVYDKVKHLPWIPIAIKNLLLESIEAKDKNLRRFSTNRNLRKVYMRLI